MLWKRHCMLGRVMKGRFLPPQRQWEEKGHPSPLATSMGNIKVSEPVGWLQAGTRADENGRRVQRPKGVDKTPHPKAPALILPSSTISKANGHLFLTTWLQAHTHLLLQGELLKRCSVRTIQGLPTVISYGFQKAHHGLLVGFGIYLVSWNQH